MLNNMKRWVKNRGILHQLVLYRTDHTGSTLYGVRVPIWWAADRQFDYVADDAVKNLGFEPTHAQIRALRRGETLRIIDVW